MKIKVIKVIKDGEEGYLKSASRLLIGAKPIVTNPLEAKNYALKENENQLEQDIKMLNFPHQELKTQAGVTVDSAHIVEIELTFQEVATQEIIKEPSKTTTLKVKI